jgi:hypothetical protein
MQYDLHIRKSIGKQKKFEKVWASKTWLTETAINSPRKVEVMATSTSLPRIMSQLIPAC